MPRRKRPDSFQQLLIFLAFALVLWVAFLTFAPTPATTGTSVSGNSIPLGNQAITRAGQVQGGQAGGLQPAATAAPNDLQGLLR